MKQLYITALILAASIGAKGQTYEQQKVIAAKAEIRFYKTKREYNRNPCDSLWQIREKYRWATIRAYQKCQEKASDDLISEVKKITKITYPKVKP